MLLMTTILRCDDVRKRFGSTVALDGLSLELRHGEILGLLGPNGAGKSTLVRAIAGRVRLDAGSISVDGENPTPSTSLSSLDVGWIPQDLALYPLLSVEENLRTFALYHGLERGDIATAVAWALEWSGLAERRGDVMRTLSGGMKRRLNMAAGVIHRPKIILLDEPTVGVDPQSRERIYTMIESMRRDSVSIIYTTHYMDEAERLCDRICIVDQGRIIASGTRDELVRQVHGSSVREARFELTDSMPPALAALASAEGWSVNKSVITLPVTDARRDLERVFIEIDRAGAEVRDASIRTPTLESVFLDLTGRELRE